LVFNQTGTPMNEGLFAYDLYITRDKPGTAPRSRTTGCSRHPAPPSRRPAPSSGLIVVNAIGDLLGANQDIVDGTKAARVYYTIDPNAAPGVYRINLDPRGTLLFPVTRARRSPSTFRTPAPP
jgi:hypothetical protein